MDVGGVSAARAVSVARSTSAATSSTGRSPSSATMRSRVAARQLVVARGHAALQGQALGLEAVGRSGVPAGRPTGVDREQHGEVGQKPTGHPLVDLEHGLDTQAASAALIGQRRVDVAVEHHDEAVRERGSHDVGDELEPGRPRRAALRSRAQTA